MGGAHCTDRVPAHTGLSCTTSAWKAAKKVKCCVHDDWLWHFSGNLGLKIQVSEQKQSNRTFLQMIFPQSEVGISEFPRCRESNKTQIWSIIYLLTHRREELKMYNASSHQGAKTPPLTSSWLRVEFSERSADFIKMNSCCRGTFAHLQTHLSFLPSCRGQTASLRIFFSPPTASSDLRCDSQKVAVEGGLLQQLAAVQRAARGCYQRIRVRE